MAGGVSLIVAKTLCPEVNSVGKPNKSAVAKTGRSRSRTAKRDWVRHFRFEALEDRYLLSAGQEFQVNTYTTGSQADPQIASDAAGDYVVVWSGGGGNGGGNYAQRYDAAGAVQGSEFQVDIYTSGTQSGAVVAMDAAGDFIVAWASYGQSGSSTGVYAQRYNAAGAAQGSEFLVSNDMTNAQFVPSVAMDSAGDFVVAWQSGQAGNTNSVYAQRYCVTGVAEGSDFLVNASTTRIPYSSVAMDSSGDFVVVWLSGNLDNVEAQRYSASGTAEGTPLQISTALGILAPPKVAMDASGDFVVAWSDFPPNGGGAEISARHYNVATASLGSAFQVNAYTTGNQDIPSVAMDSSGDFVVSWQSPQDGSDEGVFAQAYTSAGTVQGSEFQVNTYTTNFQGIPAVPWTQRATSSSPGKAMARTGVATASSPGNLP